MTKERVGANIYGEGSTCGGANGSKGSMPWFSNICFRPRLKIRLVENQQSFPLRTHVLLKSFF